jgi:hypothetical protein
LPPSQVSCRLVHGEIMETCDRRQPVDDVCQPRNRCRRPCCDLRARFYKLVVVPVA